METPLPYYMTYETPCFLNGDRRNQIDYDYMKSMYPDTARRLLPYIEEECDRMGYQGSILFVQMADGNDRGHDLPGAPEKKSRAQKQS